MLNHGVIHPHKPEKVHVVFNPSSPFKGTSLNDQLYKGPDLLTSPIGVLLSFWQFPFPISGDIEKMYHQVLVPHPQQSLFRFLWNDSPYPAEPKEYQMVVHFFGAVSSPSNCIFALKKTAEDFRNRFQTVAAAVHSNIYVDNYLDYWKNPKRVSPFEMWGLQHRPVASVISVHPCHSISIRSLAVS